MEQGVCLLERERLTESQNLPEPSWFCRRHLIEQRKDGRTLAVITKGREEINNDQNCLYA